MKKKLIVISGGFPYGTSEPFLKQELKYLSRHFDAIEIISVNPDSNTIISGEDYPCTIYESTNTFTDKIFSLLGRFGNTVQEEISVIKNVYKKQLNKSILTTLLSDNHAANAFCNYLAKKYPEDKATNYYFYSYWCDFTALGLAKFRQKRADIRCFSRVHGWDVYFNVHKTEYLPFRHFITNNIDKIFAVSEAARFYCINSWKIKDTNKVHVSRLGVAATIRNEKRSNIIVSCSALISLKRVELIIEALSLVDDHDIKWYHFGDGPEMHKLKALATNRLKPNIHWDFAGWWSNADILKWYTENSPLLFINTSSSEGIPVSIMEAMAAEIPVIATNVGGTSEIVNDKNGVLLSPNPGPEEIAASIKYFLTSDNDQIKSTRNAAFETWNEKFNDQKNYTLFAEHILGL